MEAAASESAPARELGGDRAARIVEAMRTSVAARGAVGSTFDHVAREAGVSRGLLHYYFGTKERLLVEAVRRESEMRLASLEEAVARAATAEEVLAALVAGFEEFLGSGQSSSLMFFEVLTLGQRAPGIAAELAELGRRMRTHLAGALSAKARDGVLPLAADPEAAAALLFALADGVVVRRLVEPELDIAPLMALAINAARALLS